MHSVMSYILDRKSIRTYTSEKVSKDAIMQLLTAANCAPSVNNMQPWRFSVVMNNKELIKKLSSLTVHHNWVKNAPCLIVIFLDTKSLGDKSSSIYLRHTESIGAAIQNIILAAQELGLGTCWISEILKYEDKVRELLGVTDDLQLMAVITVGYSSGRHIKSNKKDIIVNWL